MKKLFLIITTFLCFNSQAVVNGNPIEEGEFPNLVALTMFDSIYCSGVLISPKEVLTAAHCVQGYKQDHILNHTGVYIGPGKHNGKVKPQFQVDNIDVHPDYIPGKKRDFLANSDLAVITLKSEAPYVYEAIKLDQKNLLGKELLITGYGKRNEYPRYVYENAFGVAYVGKSQIVEIGESEIRASNGPSYSCAIDSGAPVYIIEDEQIKLLGITSRGSSGCDADAVYSLIAL